MRVIFIGKQSLHRTVSQNQTHRNKKKLRGALWALEPKDTAGYRSAVVVHPWDENTDLDKPSGRSAGSELENGTRSYDERMLKERTWRSPDNADVQF